MLAWLTRSRIGSARIRRAQKQRASEPTGRRLVFVGGAPRSGTTLLQHMLDSHPEIFGGPEFDCIPTIIQTWQRVVQAFDAGRIAVFCTRPQIDRTFAALVENLLLPAADANGAKLLSEKTPFNVLVFAGLLELLPECRAIHIVRDPRAVISSMLQVAARCRVKGEPVAYFIDDIHSAIRFTNDCLTAGYHAGQRHPDRVLTLSYETLVSHPDLIADRLCSFLNLTHRPEMLQPHAVKHPGQDELAKVDNGTWLDPSLAIRPIERSRLTAWSGALSPEHAELIQSSFRDHPALKALGYELK